MSPNNASPYKSHCQKARVITEAWGRENLYCPTCECNELHSSPPNAQAIDYLCPSCEAVFQLKSKSSRIGDSIPDAGFYAMMKAIREDRTPNLFVLHYDRSSWSVRNVILVPKFAFTCASIVKRKPLAPTARRAGWVGCNIVLKNIPAATKIPLISDGNIVSYDEVRLKYRKVTPLQQIGVKQRGWTLDVLRCIQTLGKIEFETKDAYVFEPELKRFYPENRYVRQKIRQQLQVLRDMGLLHQVERGRWQIKIMDQNKI